MINQETKTRIQKYFDEACKELHIDSSLYTLRFCIDDGRFPSAFNSAEWGGNTLYINEEWVELCLRSDCEFDLRYILSHEARHLYQHQVIADFKQRGKSSELPAVINQWEYEFLHYIRNEGDEDSMDKNTNQQVEIPILKEIAPLIEHYQQIGFPVIDKVKANKIIKVLAARCGINEAISRKEYRGGETTIVTIPKYELISFHTARRS